jgi:hypothetical protein
MKQPIRQYQDTEKTRDRSIQRTIEIFEPPKDIDPQWQGINCVVKVFRQGIRGKQPYQSKEPTYYICSLSGHSSLIPAGIRQHWHIENRLHWVKDVGFAESESKAICSLECPPIFDYPKSQFEQGRQAVSYRRR